MCVDGAGGSGGGNVLPGGKGLSLGSKVLVVLFIAVAAYLIIGIYLNRRNNEGDSSISENIPHQDFWKSLPGLVKDGIIFSTTKLTSCISGKSKSGYNDVSL